MADQWWKLFQSGMSSSDVLLNKEVGVCRLGDCWEVDVCMFILYGSIIRSWVYEALKKT
jgi:hypothetical protein